MISISNNFVLPHMFMLMQLGILSGEYENSGYSLRPILAIKQSDKHF